MDTIRTVYTGNHTCVWHDIMVQWNLYRFVFVVTILTSSGSLVCRSSFDLLEIWSSDRLQWEEVENTITYPFQLSNSPIVYYGSDYVIERRS